MLDGCPVHWLKKHVFERSSEVVCVRHLGLEGIRDITHCLSLIIYGASRRTCFLTNFVRYHAKNMKNYLTFWRAQRSAKKFSSKLSLTRLAQFVWHVH